MHTKQYQAFSMKAMGTTVTAYGISEKEAWEKQVAGWFAHFEKTCSRFRSDSALSQFNHAAPGFYVLVNPLLYDVMKEAWQYAKMTDFAFNPFLLESMEAIGYDHPFKKGVEATTIFKSSEVYRSEDLLEWNDGMKAIKKNKPVKIDLGGIGKGYSTDRAATMMKQTFGCQSGLVDAGGDLYVWNKNDRWTIGIQHPMHENEEIMQLYVETGGIATSSKQYRSWMQNGKKRHHLLDGHTGLPSESNVLQATVIGTNATEADVYAKILCTLNEEDIATFTENYAPHLAYVVVLTDGRVDCNPLTARYR